VRGKEVWRITGVSLIENLHILFKGDKEKMAVWGRIFALLSRLLHGEEKNEKLFGVLVSAFEFFKLEKLSNENKRNAEAIIALRVLNSLGYLGGGESIAEFIDSPYFTADLISKMSVIRKMAFEEINRSLKETHL
jgi:recombinational DNA repair protein (RecF pathway)